MKFLARTQMLSHYPLLEALDAAEKLGFNGVELCMERRDWSIIDFDEDTARRVREKTAEIGLIWSSLSFHQDYVYNDEEFEATKRLIPLTPLAGCKTFVFSGSGPQRDDTDSWSRMVGRTRDLVRVAEDSGVTIAKEFEPGFIAGSSANILRLFDEIDSPNLCANLDIGHAFLEDDGPVDSIKKMGAKIAHCHIEGMQRGVHQHLLPTEGDIDLKSCLDALAAIRFEGGLALDLYDYDYEKVSPDCLTFLRGLI
jgi:sugar phosphate isomerase/epimerase